MRNSNLTITRLWPVLSHVEHCVECQPIANRPVPGRPQHVAEEAPTLDEAQEEPPVLPSPEVVRVSKAGAEGAPLRGIDVSFDAGLAPAYVPTVGDDEYAQGAED